jgi:diguanylate cyclase (GGDEF)-like protein
MQREDDTPMEEQGSPLPTRSESEALTVLRQQSIELFSSEFQTFLGKLADHLFTLSAKSKQTSTGYNFYYDAMKAVERNTARITDSMAQELASYYEDVTLKTDNHDVKDIESLGLVNIDEFETHLRIDKIINVGLDQCHLALECLTIRLALLMKLDPNNVYLPVHVEKISRAFPDALKGQEIPRDAISDILEYFKTEFIAQLGTYYEQLNAPLRAANIRPKLEEEVKEKGSLLKKPNKIIKRSSPKPRPQATPRSAEANTAEQDTGQQGSSAGEAVSAPSNTSPGGQFSPDSLYNSVISALNFKREADALGAGQAPAAAVPTQNLNLADTPTIASALGNLQHNVDARRVVSETSSLRDYLTANQHSIEGLQNGGGLTQESINQIDLVDNLFGSIQSQVDVTSELKPALGSLQIPLAKLALLEPHFFVDKQHPARGVVDKLAQLATSANFPNKALERRIERIIEQIITEYDDDSVVFGSALTNVDKLVAQQQRAQSRNLERVVKTQQGQQKLDEAHLAVQHIIDTKFASQIVPEVLLNLINCGWRDLLILTHLREGTDSSIWTEQVKTLDILAFWLGQQHDHTVDDDMLVQRSLEAEPLIDMISQEIAASLPSNIAHGAVLDTLRRIFSGQEDVKMVAAPAPMEHKGPLPEEVRKKIQTLPRINRWIKRVNQLEVGIWLSYKDKQSRKRRMQLAWASENRDRFIFVNERGQRHADLSAVQLARRLSRGIKPPTPTDKLSLVDQSMYSTLEQVQKSLSFARNHDALTKLINYDTFLHQLGRALRHAERKNSQHAVLYLDIDQFHLVNDIYNEENGNLILLEFAKLLAQLHGKKVSSCRIEGNQFGVLMLDKTIEQAVKYAEKIRSDIESSSIEIADEKVTFTVSIGVAPIGDYSPGAADLIQFAKSAMNLAKNRGRNQVVEFEEDQGEIDRYRKKQAEEKSNLKKTIETHRFALRAQPIVQTTIDGSSGKSQHYELLLGLKNKDGTLSSPVEFIESAERYGYMGLVDRWVVKEAFSWISKLMDSEKKVPSLSINLSGSSITDDSFMDYVLEQISEFGVGTSKLCFEITETGAISNLVKAADFVRAFRNIGCKFSIDDFGTGLASHNYLRELPVDYVKIDGTFIKEIDKNRTDYAMTRSINDLAHFLGQKTIAESVESTQIIEILTEIGVDYLQGWGVGKPKLLTEIAADLDDIEK